VDPFPARFFLVTDNRQKLDVEVSGVVSWRARRTQPGIKDHLFTQAIKLCYEMFLGITYFPLPRKLDKKSVNGVHKSRMVKEGA